ncbi:response regulator [Rheinheimera soli]|uniref:histidine kinase n=1 Tax=Rheinheimera soli TaxID=443616 RepID=A0ABU1W4G5_9GAMM|nr:response regulator [Rheinheimera soli]MDR7122695.1 two-component system chemotaxis sensor kinase CheA [Rheinheimera soli]
MDREALQKLLLSSFRQEAEERLQLLADQLSGWEEENTSEEQVEDLFREVHSLKGAARAVGQNDTEQLCHHWESLLAAARKKPALLCSANLELCRQALTMVRCLSLEQLVDIQQQTELKKNLEAAAKGQQWQAPSSAEPPDLASNRATASEPERVKVSNHNLTTLLFLAEEAQQLKQDNIEYHKQLKQVVLDIEELRKKQSQSGLHSDWFSRLLSGQELQQKEQKRELLNYADWSQQHMDQLYHTARKLQKSSARFCRDLVQFSDNFYTGVQSVLLVAGSVLFAGLPAMAQDLSRQTGKQLELELQDNNLQIDKRIIDELKPVLLHLVRNAIDHGIESAADRLSKGKTAKGKVVLALNQNSADQFELCITDDGQGIDIQRLKAEACAKGLFTETELQLMSEAEALALVFHSGLSTSALITEISGRGLGMAIVQDIIERLSGQIELQSVANQSCSIRISLPVSLSTFQALFIRCADRTLALPLFAVERCIRLKEEDIQYVENRATLAVGSQVLALWQLSDVLELADTKVKTMACPNVVILKVRGESFALSVDTVLGDREITVKALGPQLKKVQCVLGATLMGDGQLIPILDPTALYHKSKQVHTGAQVSGQAQQKSKCILVADDSFTSRALLKSILETAGYLVMTANDGQEAWNQLKQQQFDLLVSDVEMPKMDGFHLTLKVRNDAMLSSLPVILVTALQSPDDRQRGLEAGANAYLVKSGFEQDSLLDSIQRLI